jgi:ferredoxin
MRVHVDASTCSGHGRCYAVAPAVFDCDDEGFPVVLVDPLDSVGADGARAAVDGCPERAISIVEA